MGWRSGAHFIVLSAVLAGVKDIREAVEQAQALRRSGRSTVLFVDEVHRFNKAQQDAFLPHVEAGLFSFIGATTENPSFEVNSALLSRAAVHVLQPLDETDLGQLLDRAGSALAAPPFVASARDQIIAFADGDGRRLLNAFETVVAGQAHAAQITPEHLEAGLHGIGTAGIRIDISSRIKAVHARQRDQTARGDIRPRPDAAGRRGAELVAGVAAAQAGDEETALPVV